MLCLDTSECLTSHTDLPLSSSDIVGCHVLKRVLLAAGTNRSLSSYDSTSSRSFTDDLSHLSVSPASSSRTSGCDCFLMGEGGAVRVAPDDDADLRGLAADGDHSRTEADA